MTSTLLRVFEKLFPVLRHEWPKALMLLSVAILLGIGSTSSRAVSEALFLTRFGVGFLPYVQLVNPFLVLISTTLYGIFAGRISNDRMIIYTGLIPIPLIFLMRFLMAFNMDWVYFLLFTFVQAYASVLITSWAVYLSGHYDVQEAKRLLPFINSGLLMGYVIGGIGVALSVSVIGAANALFLWIGSLLAVTVVVQGVAKLFTPLQAEARKVVPSSQKSKKKPGVLENFKEGVVYSRSSPLFMTTAIGSIATVMALQLIDFEYSKIFTHRFPDSAQLTAFLGVTDGLTTILALAIQWFVVPRCIRGLGVQGTNLMFPYTLTAAFGGILFAPALIPGVFARFTRYSLMPSLRGTTRTLILNAVPRKTGALVRSFNTGIVMPIGQGVGAITLLLLKGFPIPLVIPIVGCLTCLLYVFYTHKQNKAYSGALLDLLKEDRVHLLDLEDDEIRQLDAAAVAAISERLKVDQQGVARQVDVLSEEQDQMAAEMVNAQEEASLAAIELLRAVGNQHAVAALREHLPYATPRLTAAALLALAGIGDRSAVELLYPYLDDTQPEVRNAAIAGLQQLGDSRLAQRAVALLNDPAVQVRVAALAVVLATPNGPEFEDALQTWETMLVSDDRTTRIAAMSIIAEVHDSRFHKHLYHALSHQDLDVRHAALEVLQRLAEAGHIQTPDAALVRSLEDQDIESRNLALQIFAALGNENALAPMLVLLDDEQPVVRETLTRSVKVFGRYAIEPLLDRLRSPQTSLLGKETALLALARLDGVQADQLLPFWEEALRDLYQYKLMLACLDANETIEADIFLTVALQNAYDQLLPLLVQLLAVWASPEVARLVEEGLHDVDRHKRAQALEALENLGERRFTRQFLPILEASEGGIDAWRDVAKQRWDLSFSDLAAVVEASLKSTNMWVVGGALLAERARAFDGPADWHRRLEQIAVSGEGSEMYRNAVHFLLEQDSEPLHRCLSLTEVMLFLKRIPLYRSMSLDQLHMISRNLVEYDMQRGEVIFQEGDTSHDLYLIVSGKVKIVKQREDIDRTLVIMSAGDYFGDMAIFEDRPRSAGAIADEDGVLLVLGPARFRHIILQEPAISFEIFRELSARLRRFDQDTSEAAV
ncbi:MAG: cyclic nucleotide-binding domain-containing protein [bacterium]|nr:cyclic nucleotide-binding domain-containing protein [bacterium]